MEVKVRNVANNELIDAVILKVMKKDGFPKGWNFDWNQLYSKNSMFYKLVLKSTSEIIEGLIMISIIDNKMVYMNNIEVAPHNYGVKGKYKNIAGCLIAYACLLSYKYGKESYQGFLTFDSKTQLIELYQKKYNAVLIGRQKMFISETSTKKLIKEYLDISI